MLARRQGIEPNMCATAAAGVLMLVVLVGMVCCVSLHGTAYQMLIQSSSKGWLCMQLVLLAGCFE
jgi:hypothetical protein